MGIGLGPRIELTPICAGLLAFSNGYRPRALNKALICVEVFAQSVGKRLNPNNQKKDQMSGSDIKSLLLFYSPSPPSSKSLFKSLGTDLSSYGANLNWEAA